MTCGFKVSVGESLLHLPEEEGLSGFYKEKGGAQGRRGRCKECYRAAEGALWRARP